MIGISHAMGSPSVAANFASRFPNISSNGRWVTFRTSATNMFPSDTNNVDDVVRYDRLTGVIDRMSVGSDGSGAIGISWDPMSTDSGDVVFFSWAQNLVFGDTNHGSDVFMRTFNLDFPEPYCMGKTGSNGCIPFLTTDPGSPSVSSTSAWNVRSNDMHDAEAGFGIFGFKKSNLNFHGGKLCVKTPFTRTPLAKTKQVACVDPFGSCGTSSCRQLRRNMTVTIQNDTTGLLTAGQVVRFQMLQRDPTEPQGFGDNLSNGVQFMIAP